MKKILISLSIIGVVAAIVIGGTYAYFSDTTTSTGNIFRAGTLDIDVEGENFTWTGNAVMEDMKPCYTDYINFRVNNDIGDPNPVNIYKRIYNVVEDTGAVSEPECAEQGGVLIGIGEGATCDFINCDTGTYTCVDNNNLSAYINYDLYVEVYDSDNEKIWWQTIYVDGDNMSVNDVYANGEKEVFLGMIPAGGYMLVKQSYHLRGDIVTNWAQGDQMTFDIEIKGEQLHGTAILENKEGAEPWKLLLDDDITGTLNYKVKNPTFDFTFSGKAPLANTGYCLIVGGTAIGESWDPDTEAGCGTSDSDGNITITDNVELDKNLKDAKAWLVPATNWNGTSVTWGGWPGIAVNFLWERGMIWYEDTDLE